MKLGIIVYSNDPETVQNAFEFSRYALQNGDQVRVCLLGKGVEADSLSKTESYAAQPFKVLDEMQQFISSGGQILASTKCLAGRELGVGDLCTSSTMKDIYGVVKESDKVVTF